MELVIKGKTYNLPIFMPDATHATIKGVDSLDLAATGLKGLVTNTYHLIVDDAVETVKLTGGIKKFMNFDGLVITDSGGFQAMSLVRRRKNAGKFTEDGVMFHNPHSGKRLLLTPESCIETQIKLGSDIIMVLDDCTHPDEKMSEQEISVERTIRWARRCKVKYDELTKNLSPTEKPMIFGIVQGGNSKELRKKCFKGLQEIGFDGYAYGGWPLDETGLLREILDYTAKLIPDDKPKYAMGVGKPNDIIECYKMSYNMFDCVIPTRDARHGRLYVIKDSKVETINIGNERFKDDFTAVDSDCECYACKNFTKSYMRHLFKVGESVFYKLASIHNVYTFNKVIEKIEALQI
jgi:queuine tRNA-ribosyltransferase